MSAGADLAERCGPCVPWTPAGPGVDMARDDVPNVVMDSGATGSPVCNSCNEYAAAPEASAQSLTLLQTVQFMCYRPRPVRLNDSALTEFFRRRVVLFLEEPHGCCKRSPFQ
jgi:hypothetical protein